jgi:hypothetical protein
MFLGTDKTSVESALADMANENDKLTASRQLDEVELLALFWPRAVRGNKWVHEGFKVWAPPLRQCIPNLPLVIYAFARKLTSNRCQTLIETFLEAVNLFIVRLQVVARQLEEGVCYLQHENVGMVVLMAHQNAFTSATHAMFIIVFLKSA